MSTPDMQTEQTEATRSPFAFSRSELVIMILVLIFYSLTRVIDIVDFPIFFFCDEATQANLAEALAENGLRDDEGNLFPPYFRNGRTFNLSLSVWILAPVVTAFGKSIAIVRLTAGLVGLLGTAALMLALKIGFRSRLWWVGGLVLAAFPGWFLHSRTAFETVMMVGFYALFILAYLLYREISPRWLPVAIVFGGATFYSYSNGQGVMFVSIALLLIFDRRYHWRVVRDNRKLAILALVTAIVIASPYIRFRFFLHPEMVQNHLKDLDSYWLHEIPVQEKIGFFFKTYGEGLSPNYWFTDDTLELNRHRMMGYGYLPVWLSPMILLGVLVAIRRCWRSAPHRLVLIAVLAAPFSAAFVDIRITRVLAMMVPAAILAVIGLDCVRKWLQRWVPTKVFASVVAAGLITASSTMTADALNNGALWFRDYGLNGMQWGAPQLYGELRRQLESDPERRFVVTHSWANLPGAFTRFFLDPALQKRMQLKVIDEYIVDYRPDEISTHHVFVMTSTEYRMAIDHEMFDAGEPLHVIPHPDGEPGFLFARIAYSETARDFFEAERRKRREPVESRCEYKGIEAIVIHPKFDMGDIGSVFDGDFDTIARTLDADPASIVLHFAETLSVGGVRLGLWAPSFDLTIRVEARDGTMAEATLKVEDHIRFATHELMLPAPVAEARTITLVIDKHGDNKAHIQEIVFLP